MKHLSVALIFVAFTAQAADFSGHYYLQNVREVGSELLLKPDGTFDYMLAYGAADYWAKGTWRATNGGVVLTSAAGDSKPPFRLLESRPADSPGVRVFVLAPNGRPVPNIDVILQAGGSAHEARTDSEGVAFFGDLRSAQSATFRIRVYRFESDPIKLDPAHRDFRFEINGQAITQVSFHDERLASDGKALVMLFWDKDHPMRYARQ